ncbi:hypothetical protein [Mucilaginibacter sp.]
MKHKILLLIISGILLYMICCKKGNTSNAYALTGKWQEVKLRTYNLDSGKITSDTTYLHSFTNMDYVQFSGGGICEISTSGYFYTTLGIYVNPKKIDTTHYTAIDNGKFTLNTLSALPNPSGFITADTISEINTNNILIHSVFYSNVAGYKTISDTYYQK